MKLHQDDELLNWLVAAGLLSDQDREVVVAAEAKFGGGVDSVLLETGQMSEAAMTDALAQTFSIPPASLETDFPPTQDAVERIPEDVAMRLGVCPLRPRAEGLVIAVKRPATPADLDELTRLIDGTLYLVITPEVRLREALHRGYGLPLQSRWRGLLAALSDADLSSWVESTSSGHNADGSDALCLSSDEVTGQLAATTSRSAACDVVLRAVGSRPECRAVVGVRERRLYGWGRAGDFQGLLFDMRVPLVPERSDLETMFAHAAPLLGPPAPTPGNEAFYGWLGREPPAVSGFCPIRVGGKLVGALYVEYPDSSRDFSEETALAALLGSTLERVIRERVAHAADENPSPSASEADNLLFAVSSSAATRAVPLAHALVPEESPGERADPVPCADDEPAEDASPSALAVEAEPEPWAALADELETSLSSTSTAGAAESASSTDIHALVAQLASESMDEVEDAATALIELGVAALSALKSAFPGKLLLDPFSSHQLPRTAAHLGPLIEVMAALGHEGLTACLPFLDAKDREQRFAATYLFRVCPDALAIQFLRHRLNDPEPLVSELAASALAPFVEHADFREVLEHYRRRLTGATVEGRVRAAWLLGEFRDVASVPQLMVSLTDRAEVANAAYSALTKITLQDLGYEAATWRSWWKSAKQRCRVEWLLEGLVSSEFDLRELSGRELSLLAGTDFGYHGDDPQPRREEATQQFGAWWERTRATLSGES